MKEELYGNTDYLTNNSESYTFDGEVMTNGMYLSRQVKRSDNIKGYYCTVFNITFFCIALGLNWLKQPHEKQS